MSFDEWYWLCLRLWESGQIGSRNVWLYFGLDQAELYEALVQRFALIFPEV
ncbi:MAG: hypothetical protein H6729_04785 [Deltaproteobacteria bacterium]|nr:hypothetical protein [Deltaproteobacteria bacterium]